MNLIKKNFLFNKAQIGQFSKSFAQILSKGMMIFLMADLGAGKTFFVQNICKFLNDDKKKEEITSPTFVFYHTYHFQEINIWHYDLYRFENEISENDLLNIDFFDAQEDGVLFVEWADKLKISHDKISNQTIILEIKFPKNKELFDEYRSYQFSFHKESAKFNQFFEDFEKII
jgi:tRNA threonylcarbamoyladenosine biosynthesis protein TsaE